MSKTPIPDLASEGNYPGHRKHHPQCQRAGFGFCLAGG